MPSFRRVSSGDSIATSPPRQADWINAVSAAAADYQQRRAGGNANKPPHDLKTSSGLVKVRNIVNVSQGGGQPAGRDLKRGHYVQLGAYLLNKTDPNNSLNKVDSRHLWFEGKLYGQNNNGGIAILTRAIREQEVGPARRMGVCTAIVNVTDTEHRFAAPSDGKYVLQSASSGLVELLATASETGEQELSVVLGGGGGSGDLSAVTMIVTEKITNATGDLDEIEPGSGRAAFYDRNALTRALTRRLDGTGQPLPSLPCNNDDPTAIYEVGAVVKVALLGSFSGETWYDVLSGSCAVFSAPPVE